MRSKEGGAGIAGTGQAYGYNMDLRSGEIYRYNRKKLENWGPTKLSNSISISISDLNKMHKFCTQKSCHLNRSKNNQKQNKKASVDIEKRSGIYQATWEIDVKKYWKQKMTGTVKEYRDHIIDCRRLHIVFDNG